MAAGTHW